MRSLFPVLPLLVFMGLSFSGSGAAQSVNADQLVPVVQGAFKKCGRSLTLSDALSRAARDVLTGQELKAAIRAQGFAVFRAQEWELTFNGNVNWVSSTLAGQCGKLDDLDQYGLSTDGKELVVIVARAAVVDLTQKARWMSEFLTLTNRARAQARTCGTRRLNAAGPLRWDARLEAAAAQHAQDMIRLNFRGHVNPQTGSEPWQRALAAGFRGSVGENLAYGMLTPQDAVQSLLASPLHCENLMDARWTLFGASVANGTASTLFPTYWAQVFGAP